MAAAQQAFTQRHGGEAGKRLGAARCERGTGARVMATLDAGFSRTLGESRGFGLGGLGSEERRKLRPIEGVGALSFRPDSACTAPAVGKRKLRCRRRWLGAYEMPCRARFESGGAGHWLPARPFWANKGEVEQRSGQAVWTAFGLVLAAARRWQALDVSTLQRDSR